MQGPLVHERTGSSPDLGTPDGVFMAPDCRLDSCRVRLAGNRAAGDTWYPFDHRRTGASIVTVSMGSCQRGLDESQVP